MGGGGGGGGGLAKHLDTKAISGVTTRDLENIVTALDRDVRAKKLSWKTAIHVWGLLTKLFDDACRSKDVALRARTDNPAKSVRGPDRGHDLASAFLFPAELIQLAACGLVPEWRRRLYVFAVYTGLRAGEIRALEWTDVHEDEGFIAVNRAIDYQTGETKSTKTGKTRRVPIEAALVPMIQAMREEEGKGEVFARLPHKSEFPWILREDLNVADVKRSELHDDTPTSRKLDFHDLRHTYGTWRAIRGDDVIKIRFAMGHTDLTTTQRYINESTVFDGPRFGVPFGPLPELCANSVSGARKPATSLCPQRESNPR